MTHNLQNFLGSFGSCCPSSLSLFVNYGCSLVHHRLGLHACASKGKTSCSSTDPFLNASSSERTQAKMREKEGALFFLFTLLLVLSQGGAVSPSAKLSHGSHAGEIPDISGWAEGSSRSETSGSGLDSPATQHPSDPFHHRSEAAITDTKIVLPSGDPLGGGSATLHKPLEPYLKPRSNLKQPMTAN